jgi:predicted enzyme related to lactoylglutathione lyase
MNRVVHFEIHAEDPDRACKFYSDLFGWDFKEWIIPGQEIKNENRYWMAMTGDDKTPGINGGLMFRQGPAPAKDAPVNSFVCTIDVESIDKQLEKMKSSGGEVVVPKMPVMNVGWLAYCKDTEGNLFGMMQMDESAK